MKDIYPDILKRFVDNFSKTYFDNNNYKNLKQLKIIKEYGLPVDCVLRTAPLPHKTKSEIQGTTVDAPEKEIYTNYENAETFGAAKSALLTKVTLLMRDICRSLRDKNKMPDDLDGRMNELRQFITEKFNRNVFVDEQAKVWWEKENGPDGTKRLENWTQQVEEMLLKIAGEGTIQLVMQFGTMGFSCVRGIQIESFAMKRKILN